jgi:hypothetical protein
MNKQNAIKIARLGLLLTIVVLAFAIIIAAPMESATDVALAAVDAQGGTAKGIYGNGGELTASRFGFPGSGSNKTEWTHTVEFSGVGLNTSNISTCLYNTTKALFFEQVGNGSFRFGKTGSDGYLDNDGWQAYAVLNYQLSPFLKTMISNTNATVQVTGFTCKFERANGDESSIRVFASSGAQTAANCGVNGDVTTTGFVKTDNKNTTMSYSSKLPITLASSHNVVAMAFEIGGGRFSDGDNPVGKISDLKLTFKISITQADYSGTVINDGEAPILQSVDTKSPFRTDSAGDWNYALPSDITTSVEEEIKSLYNQNIDRVDANNNVYLHSYVNPETDAKTTSGVTYYKELNETFVDQYSYGSSVVVANDAGKKWYASGIKYVKVGDSYLGAGSSDSGLWAFDQEGKSTSLREIKVDGVTVGWGRVYVYHRSKIQVQLYFAKNVDVTVTVIDYGDKQVSKTVSVKGIDVQANSAMESILDESKDYFLESGSFVDASSWNQIKWNYNLKMTFDFAEDNVERLAGQSPYMWYYSVVKADSPTTLNSANWTKDVLMGKTPFAVSGLGFTYDFKTGLANGEIGNQTGANATGSGYYLFTFYKMTLSGKFDSATGVRSYYVKVDYEEPVHTLNKSSNGIDLENIDWAAGG